MTIRKAVAGDFPTALLLPSSTPADTTLYNIQGNFVQVSKHGHEILYLSHF